MNKSNMNKENKTIKSKVIDLNKLSNARTSIKRKITNNINQIS